MVTYLLFGAMQAISVANSILNKKFQIGIKNNLPTMIMYNLINAIFGSIYFFLLCKCHIEMNGITMLFSVIYAIMVINSLAVGIVSLSKVSIPFSAIVAMAGGVIGSAVFGILCFGEPVSGKQIFAMLLLIGAVAVTALASPELKYKRNSAAVCVWHFLTCFFTSPFMKFYTVTPGVLEANNMFFMTNLLAALISLAYVIIYIAKKGKLVAKESFGCVLEKSSVINIASRTALSNLNSVISVIIIAGIDLTLYNILSSALGLIANGYISRFVFREKLIRENYISILLAIAAIIVRTI